MIIVKFGKYTKSFGANREPNSYVTSALIIMALGFYLLSCKYVKICSSNNCFFQGSLPKELYFICQLSCIFKIKIKRRYISGVFILLLTCGRCTQRWITSLRIIILPKVCSQSATIWHSKSILQYGLVYFEFVELKSFTKMVFRRVFGKNRRCNLQIYQI